MKKDKLKTLKDLEEEELEERMETRVADGGIIDENELWYNARLDLLKTLKAEAVKWIKSDEVGLKGDFFGCVVKWIKHFFNLTEEDLEGLPIGKIIGVSENLEDQMVFLVVYDDGDLVEYNAKHIKILKEDTNIFFPSVKTTSSNRFEIMDLDHE